MNPKLANISLMNNLLLGSVGIHRYRSWKVGNVKLIPLSKLEQPKNISTIACGNTLKNKTILFTITRLRNKQQNFPKQSNDTYDNS